MSSRERAGADPVHPVEGPGVLRRGYRRGRPTNGSRAGLLRRGYGAGPLHLLAVAGCLVVAVYSVTRVLADLPVAVRIAAWFVGAAVVWDLVLGPLLALGDRGLRAVLRRPVAGVVPLNFVRIPLLVCGALLLVSAPLVLRRSPQVYAAKTTLDQSVFAGRWLAVSATLAAASAAAFGLTVLRRRRR